MPRRSFLAGAAAGLVAACSGDDGPGKTGPSNRSRNRVNPVAFAYGDHREQVADLSVPVATFSDGAPGVVVLIHGGYWRPGFDRSLMAPLAADVVARGWAAWNLDYRPAGRGGGGWPGTFVDVAAGVDRLAVAAERHALDLDQVVIAGHSAGGCLALWAAARGGLPPGAPGAVPRVVPRAAVSMAGVNNLIAGVFEDLGAGAVLALMGLPPDEAGDRYTLASPTERLPLGVPQVVVHGTADTIVPLRQSTAYAGKAEKAGDDVELLTIDGADHFDLIDPRHPAWQRTAGRIATRLDR